MRHTCALGHLLIGCEEALLLYRLDEIVQGLVQVETGCMLDLFGDGRPVDVVQNRSLKNSCQSNGETKRVEMVQLVSCLFSVKREAQFVLWRVPHFFHVLKREEHQRAVGITGVANSKRLSMFEMLL